MGVGDILSTAGNVLGQIGKTAGRAVEEFAPQIGTALRGDAGEVAKEQRTQQFSEEERRRELQADQLEKQLDAGRKYGTLSAEQQQDLVRQITSIYPQAQHAPALMTRLHRIARGPSADGQGPLGGESLGVPTNIAQATTPNAFPAEGTQRRDAAAYLSSHPKMPTKAMADITQLNSYAQKEGYQDYWTAPFDVQQAAHESLFRSRTKTAIVSDDSSPTKFAYATWNTDTGSMVGERIPALAPSGYIPTESVTVDGFGVATVTNKHPVVPGVTTPPTRPALTPRGAAAQGPAPTTNGTPSPQGGVAGALTPSPAAPAAPTHKRPVSAAAPAGGGTSNMDRAANRELFKSQVHTWSANLGKTQQEANDVQTRLSTMQQTADEAKRGNGPAQVGIIASYIKSLVGGQGIRVTQTEWNQATQLAPWLQRVAAHFTPDGFVAFSQTPITPEQVDQMVNEVSIKSKDLDAGVERLMQQRPRVGNLVPKSGAGGGAGKPKNVIVVKPEDMQ